MNLGLDHLYISSFKERLDHLITNKLQAYKNIAVPLLVDAKEDRLSGYKTANGGNRQWVYDSSVAGATIAAPAGSSGWATSKVDFKNARLVAAGSTTVAPPATLNVAQKHFNIYVSSSTDEELFTQLFGNKNEVITQTEAIRADNFYAPCIFVKMGRTYNEGHALGGEDRTYFDIRVSAFVRSEFEMLAVGGVIRDMKNTMTFLLDETPLDEFNDLKERPWSFSGKMAELATAGAPKIMIEDCYFNPIKSDAINNKIPNVYIGLGTFKTFMVRHPRQ